MEKFRRGRVEKGLDIELKTDNLSGIGKHRPERFEFKEAAEAEDQSLEKAFEAFAGGTPIEAELHLENVDKHRLRKNQIIEEL